MQAADGRGSFWEQKRSAARQLRLGRMLWRLVLDPS